jgi:hypothetical protein
MSVVACIAGLFLYIKRIEDELEAHLHEQRLKAAEAEEQRKRKDPTYHFSDEDIRRHEERDLVCVPATAVMAHVVCFRSGTNYCVPVCLLELVVAGTWHRACGWQTAMTEVATSLGVVVRSSAASEPLGGLNVRLAGAGASPDQSARRSSWPSCNNPRWSTCARALARMCSHLS